MLKKFPETYAPGNCSGTRPSSPTLKEPANTNDIAENVVAAACQSSKSRIEIPRSRACALRVPTNMICSGFGNGRLRGSTGLTRVKTALFAPIPSASTRAATTVNQRSLTSRRTANLRSWSKLIGVSPNGGRITALDVLQTETDQQPGGGNIPEQADRSPARGGVVTGGAQEDQSCRSGTDDHTSRRS